MTVFTKEMYDGSPHFVIPDDVTVLGWDAFKGCTSLASVAISDSVVVIGYAVSPEMSDMQKYILISFNET